MKNSRTSIFALIILLFTVFTVEAGSRVVFEVEVTKGDNVEKSTQIITYDEKRGRIDLPGANKEVTEETPYIMTVNSGETWVMGDKQKDMFYCSEMQTEEFFKNIGGQFTDAIEFFNVKAESPSVKKVLEEPGPEILGFKTTHIQFETNAKAYAWFLFIKFEYSVKIIDDIWYATDVELHPIKRKWLNALTQSGNSIIDTLFNELTSKISGPILKEEMVVDITNARKKETKTQKILTVVTQIEELKSSELDEVFKMPKCKMMDDDEVQEKAKSLFSARKIRL